jgi:hypothetical protein
VLETIILMFFLSICKKPIDSVLETIILMFFLSICKKPIDFVLETIILMFFLSICNLILTRGSGRKDENGEEGP